MASNTQTTVNINDILYTCTVDVQPTNLFSKEEGIREMEGGTREGLCLLVPSVQHTGLNRLHLIVSFLLTRNDSIKTIADALIY